MTSTTPRSPPFRCRGVTVVEILLVVSVLIILLSFALPGIDRATARADMRAAAENVRYSIDTARRLARGTETFVVLQAETRGDPAVQSVRLTGPRVEASMSVQEYRLPKTVRLVPDDAAFTFDERGLVQDPGKVILMSLADEAIISELRVE